MSQWLDNIKNQGFIPYKAYYQDPVLSEFEEVIFDEMGKELNQVINNEEDQQESKDLETDREIDLETTLDDEEDMEM